MTAPKRHGATFLNISEHLLQQGFCVRFHAEGTSMRPAIEHGDVITIGPVDPGAIVPGDIVLYRHHDRPIAHRVTEIYKTSEGAVVVVPRGDGKSACDAPVESGRILGKVTSVKRGRQRRASSIFLSRAALRLRPWASLVALAIWPAPAIAGQP